MWPFSKPSATASPTPLQPSAPSSPSELAEVLRALQTLSADHAQLRAEMQTLRKEWDDVVDRINRWAGRENARKRRAIASQLADSDSGGADPHRGGIVAPEGSEGHFPQIFTDKDRLRARVYGSGQNSRR